MGMFDGFRRPDFDGELARYRETPGAVLLDVRAPQEYAGGHVPGSQNVPLNQLPGQIGALVPDLGTPVFVYCLSGARSGRAAAFLRRMGYGKVTDLGGIAHYCGPVEK